MTPPPGSTQTRADKIRLHAAWLADPQVIALTKAVAAHVAQRPTPATELDGFNDALAAARAWVAANGHLPDDGIKDF